MTSQAFSTMERWCEDMVYRLMDAALSLPPRNSVTQDKILQVLPQVLSNCNPTFSEHVLERLRHELEDV
ncbi:MAG: hypothetical protein K0U52_08280 [Gammaproteobacteria bacterium]|nr:hypothetical protein [Gammaproteobacteria bacterium]